MIKWFVYIVLLLIFTPCLSSAKINVGVHHQKSVAFHTDSALVTVLYSDTTNKKRQQEADDKRKIKEVTKAKRLPKPEKVDENGNANSQNKEKPKRQRRPAGLERPPEIPRRNGN
ncbi:MAG TPA: hypothetical protein VL442_17340 [Mucilaginibacter sp.]|jgi:hypothetical protein|nr:hypothetical protein [Mucilaginibacter sp.]